MPQKKNGDVFELTRGKCKVMLGYLIQEIEIFTPLLSGYNRDTQLTKEPLVKGLELAENTIKIMTLTVDGLGINKENCKKALTADIFATDYALELVKKGMPFRDAYRDVAKHLNKLKTINPDKNIKSKKHAGATGNLRLNLSKTEIIKQEKWLKQEKNKFNKNINGLLK